MDDRGRIGFNGGNNLVLARSVHHASSSLNVREGASVQYFEEVVNYSVFDSDRVATTHFSNNYSGHDSLLGGGNSPALNIVEGDVEFAD